ncbi:putative metalloprotease [Halopolyspora algeriensis]|uniref:Putative metalloprotease n=1 Tax=Halopolyspora algeriensis TaxID=1500506 RepID=A0A368VT55_9ACTN|nr:peptidase [Halopolyspora algeriensis]RCW45192.1 putative metalloprotease [Halopolyspora algeriensis]TQM53089.1 putative metalloprotease [Halopolyspora algeriensis]
MHAPRGGPVAAAVLLLAFVVALSGCSNIAGTARPTEDILVRPVDPSFVYGTDGSVVDTLAATVVTDVQTYWSRAFPEHFGSPWRDIDGGFFSVDTTAENSAPPPCTAEVADLEGNAFYCASVDAIAWDRAALLPVLVEHYGQAAVLTVLAHEMGHAVHRRHDPASGDADTSTRSALTEAIADCYAGTYTRWVVDGHSARLHVRKAQLDGAMRALTSFRAPAGTAQSDADPHGTAFDRVSAFQDGYRGGPEVCAGMTVHNRRFTSAPVTSAPEPRNRPLEQVLRSRTTVIRDYFTALVDRRGGHWATPPVRGSPPAGCATDHRAPVSYCPRPPAVVVDHRGLARVHHDIGDQASETALASRYARAALHALGTSTTAAGTAGRASCLTGAYTGSLLDDSRGHPPLSASDLDEAVTLLLSNEQTDRAASATNAPTGFDRIAAFRAGMRGGPDACRG